MAGETEPTIRTNANTKSEIDADNIRAAGAIYFAAMLEELKLFQVVDRLVEVFQRGLLPVGRKNSARRLYEYWRETSQRLTMADRKNLYTSVLGIPGGDEGTAANRDFNDLWVRFIAAVSALVHPPPAGDLSNLNTRLVAEQNVRAAGRELVENLSIHGFGLSYFSAIELRKQVDQMIKLLSDRDIQSAYGARDLWQLIDEVARLELGGSVNLVRYRTMATAGGTIIAWLAKNGRKFSKSASVLVLERQSRSLNESVKPTVPKSPSDTDLVNACEQWLAVSSISDDSTDNFSEPGQR